MEVAILIVLVFILFANVVPILLSMISPKPPKPVNFENDMIFLNFLIGTKVSHFNKYIITPAKASGRALMTDKDLTEYREGYIVEIYADMSSEYKKTLLKYFSEDGLRFYIVNTLNEELTSGILSHNLKFFNSGSNSKENDITNVSQTDI